MATSKEEIKHATAQARLTEDDALRTGYINGTPLEGGKIADSEPVDLFAHVADTSSQQPQQPRREKDEQEEETAAPTGGRRRLGRQ